MLQYQPQSSVALFLLLFLSLYNLVQMWNADGVWLGPQDVLHCYYPIISGYTALLSLHNCAANYGGVSIHPYWIIAPYDGSVIGRCCHLLERRSSHHLYGKYIIATHEPIGPAVYTQAAELVTGL